MATRWGICSTGKISNDFCTALLSLPRSQHEVVAVSGRQKESADVFAKKFSITAAYGSYLDMARDPDVEIVYVGTIHPSHFAVCSLFLDHGKHVLCEKPVTMTLQECKDICAKAKEKKLFFMEGFWTRFFPAVEKFQEVLGSGVLGRINFLQATFCVPAGGVARVTEKALGGGGLLDVGCYLVQYANLVFRQRPEAVLALGQLTQQGVDRSGTLVLKYDSGAMAVLCYSFDGAFGGNALTLYGTNGTLQLPEPMHCPTVLVLPSGERLEFPLPGPTEGYVFQNSAGMAYQAQCVRQCLLQGLLECPQMPHQDSIDIMSIMQEALTQMGVQY